MNKNALRKYAEILILTTAGTLFIAYFLFKSEYLTDLDIHFHITIADLISKQGWVSSLPWMPHSIHADRYVDFHLIIHYLQALFVIITGGDLILAARLSGLVFLLFSLAMLVLLLQELNVRYIWFWVLVFLMASPTFSLRLLFLRGSIFFIGIIFLFLLLLLRKKYNSTAVLCFLAVWTYPGFPILGIIAGFYWLALFIEGKPNHRIILLPVIGTLLGFVIHPAFPHQFYGFWLELGIHSARPPGLETIAEWAPMPHKGIPMSYGIPIVLLIGKIAITNKFEPLHKALLLALAFILFTLLGAHKPIEFFIPILVLFLAVPVSVKGRPQRFAVLGFSAIIIVLMFTWSVPIIARLGKDQEKVVPTPRYFEAADWLKANTSRGEKVLVSWADFPVFFYRNRDNIYNNGLNPVYSFGKDYIRYRTIREFYRGGGKQGIEFVPMKLKTRFAVLNKTHSPASIFWFRSIPWVKEEFENDIFVIFQFPLNEPQNAPP